MKTGWFKTSEGAVVWANGWQYIETGSAPGRVQTTNFISNLGPYASYEYDASLKPAAAQEIEAFVKNVASYYERQREKLREQIRELERQEQAWKARISFVTKDGV